MCGCIIKGYYACSIYGEETSSKPLKHSKKISFIGYRRFLSRHHPYQIQRMTFNGEEEFQMALEPLNGKEIGRAHV